ncbi:lactococcin 972 family bacteriocin [Nocardiopsis sp. CT-R113]|jgi:lactococcin 972 family bacteriocin|uniref:Lactococcin 972 family bacteriocin n=1 Tax=Nocardiopsis codii TaxID=3065942 RepID=A0ABU7K9B2_9ACTN|nr:lactococcin 972 family bacteriocin [Nocardiopsis sp. CT-R113]MEE2038828.1 lactococcin 972 family bacteriocin [Nocardiopsis sp. CT-R113]
MDHPLKRAAATLAITAGLTAGTAGAAGAAISYVGGGTWYHGLTTGRVYSDYFHATLCHGSTAVGTYTVTSAAMLPGKTSEASAPRAVNNNETYWRHCG